MVIARFTRMVSRTLTLVCMPQKSFLRKQARLRMSCRTCTSCTYARSTCFLAGSGASGSYACLTLLALVKVAAAAGDEPTFMDHARASAPWSIATAHLALPPKYGHDNPSVGSHSAQYVSTRSSSSPHSIGGLILKGLGPAAKVNAGEHILKGLVPTTHVDGDWFPTRIEFIV